MSIRLKTILGIALIEGVLLISLIALMMGFIQETSDEGLVKRATTTATLFATTTKDAVLSYDLASLDAFVEEVLRNPDLVYARVAGADGTVFAESGDRTHLKAGRFRRDVSMEQVDDDVFDTSAEISEGGVTYGRVEIGLQIAGITRAIQAASRWSAAIAASEMALVALFSFILGGYLTGQLRELRGAARHVAEGDFDISVSTKGGDEIADVARAFNRMAVNLKETSAERARYERELVELNETLEKRVQRRTAEIELKKAELETAYHSLKDTQAKLLQSEKMASIGILAAGVAHEINNPVAFVMSNLMTLGEYIEIFERIIQDYEHCSRITSDAERLAKLAELERWMKRQDYAFIRSDVAGLVQDSVEGAARVRDIVAELKELAHPDKGETLALADLNQCITSTLRLVSSELKYKCELVTDLGSLPQTYCSPGQISQVLINMLVNAGQAIEGRGEIRIRSWCDREHIFISIADDGAGIPSESIGRLFDPFYTTKPIGQGTGLGLAISYGIIADHGGDISVTSEVGRGSCFTIRLPVEEAPRSVKAAVA